MKNKMKKLIYLSVFMLWTSIIFAQDIVIDIDSNKYHTVTIGSQTWLNENLKVRHYNNGDEIMTTKKVDQDLMDEIEPKYQWYYHMEKKNLGIYGRLYTYYVVIDERKICPQGWHVSSDEEWTELENAVGGRSKAGGKLKEPGLEHWRKPNIGSKKRSQFLALPGGCRDADGGCVYLNLLGYWWTSTERYEYSAWSRSMKHVEEKKVNRHDLNKKRGLAVRCVKD